LTPSVYAQSAPATLQADPLNAKADVPAVTYRSVLGAYRPAGDVKVGSWKDANETVARIGGWRVYAREASQPESASGTNPGGAPASQAAKPDAGHGHHGKR
jgi:hypothetical protein